MALNGAKGCKSVARHVAPEDAGLGKEGRGGRETCTRGGMIRTHCTRQTAITNSTPPVGDNYRAGRERLRSSRWRTKVFAEDKGGSGSSLKASSMKRVDAYSRCLIY